MVLIVLPFVVALTTDFWVTYNDVKLFGLNMILLALRERMSKIFTLVVDCIGNQINQRQLDKSSLVGNLDPLPPLLLPDPTE